MEQQFNPYAAGQVHQEHFEPSAGIAVTPAALAAILKTQFWVKLVGIAMLIISVLTILGGLVNMGGLSGMGAFGEVFGVMIIIYLLMGAVYILLAIRLLKYAGAIQRLSRTQESNNLASAIEMQTKFWRLAGILTIIVIALYVVLIVAAIMMVKSNHGMF